MKHLSFEEETAEINRQLQHDYVVSKRLWTAFVIVLGLAFSLSLYGLTYTIYASH